MAIWKTSLTFFCVIRVGFAIYLFSLYDELKDKEKEQKRDADEFAWKHLICS